MEGVLANRNGKQDFVINELERLAENDLDVYIASAFFTDAEVVEKLLSKGCRVYLVVRLGFPTSPQAIERVSRHPNVQLRIYTSHTYHPKLYIFGDELALVGSANLTRAALLTNQEVVVSVDSADQRFGELMSIFQDYWDGAEVLTDAQLATYRAYFKLFAKHDDEVEALGKKVLAELGTTSPDNIERFRPRAAKSSLFASNFRRTYQESVAAFNTVRQAYMEFGYRKAGEEQIPLRLEIDSFISYVREKVANGDTWKWEPIRPASEQGELIKRLIDDWSREPWPHFEYTIVPNNYPRLKRVFDSPDTILAANDDDLFDALATLHSFHDRFRFFAGGLPTWKREFRTYNEPKRLRETLAYLVHGHDDIVQRMANSIFDSSYKLNEFGRANVQELIGWCNREELPILNGRTTKVLRYFGSNVRQIG